MSDTSEGQGWWIASDRKWYPPQLHPDRAVLPRPVPDLAQPQQLHGQTRSAFPGPASGPDRRKRKAWPWIVAGTVALAAVVAVAATAGGRGAPHLPASNAAVTPSSVDLTRAAASSYQHAYNAMVAAESPHVTVQNGSVSTVRSAAINQRVAIRLAFDRAVRAMTFPVNATTDVRAVLSSDAVLEAVLATLAADTDDVADYDTISVAVAPAEAAVLAANRALSAHLGLS